MDLISVIMPTHNSANWVTYTIDNLAAQTYPHFELIVADDGSRDDTVSVVRNKLARGFKKGVHRKPGERGKPLGKKGK